MSLRLLRKPGQVGLALLAIAWPISAAPPAVQSSLLIPATAEKILAAIKAPGAKGTLVNVWASWCVPCREEFPDMLKVYRAYEARGLRLILISADLSEDRPAAIKFLTEQGITQPSYVKDQIDQEFIDGLTKEWSGSLPATMVFDAKGQLVSFWEGAASKEKFETAVRRVLDGKEKAR